LNPRRRSKARRRTTSWLALALSVLLALVPGQGLVLCFEASGSVAVGMGSDCPSGEERDDADGLPAPCDDLRVDGLRERLPPDVAAAGLDAGDLVACSLELHLGTALGASVEPLARVGPRSRAAPPALQRALDARRSVVLTI